MLALIGAATFLEAFIEDIPGAAIMQHCASQHAAGAYRAIFNDDPKASGWIAEHGHTGAPVGYAHLTTPDASVQPGPGEIELKRIYVLSRFHGSGLAQRLMDCTLDHARTSRACRMRLGTYARNHRAIGFYRRNEFTIAGTRQFQVGDETFDDIIMVRDL